jgi:hypothetical protein
MSKLTGSGLNNEGLALLRVPEASVCKAAYIAVCNSLDEADAELILETIGVSWAQAKRGQRLATGRV